MTDADKQRLRILNLEDSALDADLMTRDLRRAGLEFSIFRVDTEEGFRKALRDSPDVILADYHLPTFDGMSALRIARSVVPEVPFIFVSGSIGEDKAVQALREGATDYVIKDRLSRLPSAITRALAERRERELRQSTQEALRLSEERLRYAAEAAQELIADWDLPRGRVSFNDALTTVWGYEPAVRECDASWFQERIHPDDLESTTTSLRFAIEQGSRWSGRFRFRRADGSYGHVDVRAIVIRNASGTAERMICGMLDTTEQRKAADRLRESELRFRSVAETAGDAIILCDDEGRVVFWNDGAARMFGYDREEIVGDDVTRLMPDEFRLRHSMGIQRYRESPDAPLIGRTLEFEGLRKNGETFPIEIALTGWRSGDEWFCTGLIRDTTARVEHDRRQRVQFAVAQTLAETTSVAELLSALLANLGNALRAARGFFWSIDAIGGELQCVEAWAAAPFAGTELGTLRSAVPLHEGADLAAIVARTAQAGCVRVPESSVAFPIIEHEVVTGVVEFSGAKTIGSDAELLHLLSDIGRRIGEFFERRRAEERLLQSEASLGEAQQMAKLGTFSYDLETGEGQWSEQMFEIYDREGGQELRYSALTEPLHPDDTDRVLRQITPPLHRPSFSVRFRLRSRDGSIRHCHLRMRVEEGTAESPKKLMGTVQDVTEEVEAGETIRRLSRQNELILNYAAEAIIGTDRKGRATFANPAAAALTGWSVGEIESVPDVHELIHHCGNRIPSANACPIQCSMTEGRVTTGEDFLWRKSGDSFPARFSCSPILEGSQVTGSVLIFEDLTQQKRLEQQLEQVNRVTSLGRVAATIAHEFNNVLMGIQPFAELIRRRSNDEKTQKAAAQIAGSVARGKRVTEEILRFTQPAEPVRTVIQLCGWVHELQPELQHLAGPRIEIRLERPEAPILVSGDPAQLQQVLTNLILNARDAITGAGLITISIDEHETFARLRVRDTGAGMSPEVQRNVFEPLFTTKRTGTGLGLAVAQQVISRHGGTIHVESQVGEGTTFEILLPRKDDEGIVAAGNGEPVIAARRILVVEDDPIVATGIVILLEAEGIEARTVHRGSAALPAIEEFQPDAIILDLSLPDMSGFELYERIAERHPTMPVLFSSGQDESAQLTQRAVAAPHVGFLLKPYGLDALIEALEKLTSPRQ